MNELDAYSPERSLTLAYDLLKSSKRVKADNLLWFAANMCCYKKDSL